MAETRGHSGVPRARDTASPSQLHVLLSHQRHFSSLRPHLSLSIEATVTISKRTTTTFLLAYSPLTVPTPSFSSPSTATSSYLLAKFEKGEERCRKGGSPPSPPGRPPPLACRFASPPLQNGKERSWRGGNTPSLHSRPLHTATGERAAGARSDVGTRIYVFGGGWRWRCLSRLHASLESPACPDLPSASSSRAEVDPFPSHRFIFFTPVESLYVQCILRCLWMDDLAASPSNSTYLPPSSPFAFEFVRASGRGRGDLRYMRTCGTGRMETAVAFPGGAVAALGREFRLRPRGPCLWLVRGLDTEELIFPQ